MAALPDRQARHAALAPLLDEQSPADALAAYYAFHHPADRSEFFIHNSDRLQRADGFLIRARTGLDLFRPLVTFRADTEEAAQALFNEGLQPNRPCYMMAPESLTGWINQHLSTSEAETYKIYRFVPPATPPPINVLLVTSQGPDGTPRAEIRSAANKAGAVAGVNWIAPRWAEIFVHTDPAVRGRGWGKAVVATVAQQLVARGRTPLYVTSDTNEYSMRLAEAVGFVDTGYREFVGQAVRLAEG
jgi:ribosomal protein S18 acetylase RimI-like enzyme